MVMFDYSYDLEPYLFIQQVINAIHTSDQCADVAEACRRAIKAPERIKRLNEDKRQ